MRRCAFHPRIALLAVVVLTVVALVGGPWIAYAFWTDLGEWLWEGMLADGLMACAGGVTLAAIFIGSWMNIIYLMTVLIIRLWRISRPDDNPELPPPPRRPPPEPSPVPVGGGPIRPAPLVARPQPPQP